MKFFLFFFFSLGGLSAFSQRIVYSTPEKDDTRRMNFEVIGKVAGHFQVYKNVRGRSYIVLFDNDMQQVSKEEHEYMPDERLINVDFFPYAEHSYMIYQYQKKNVVYCNAIKIDGNGKKSGEVIPIDTSHIGFNTNNRIYSAITSEDKSKLMVFKINSRNKQRYVVTTLLLNDQLAQLQRSTFALPMEEREDKLDDFSLDNRGDLVFTKFRRASNETITQAALLWKPAQVDTLTVFELPLDKLFLDEPTIKVDNANNRYFLTSFFYKQKRGNIEGFYFYVWDKDRREAVMNAAVPLTEELRREAKGEANIKTAFNDYFIKNIIIRKDGGFLINSEAYYTTSRFNNWNRWNYLYGMPLTSFDYMAYSPLYSNWWWRSRYNNNQSVRHHADNITVLSFDNTGRLEWSNVIHKEQFDDESQDRISYQILNTGGQLHYLFNMDEKRALLLNDYTLNPDGSMNRNPTLKNLDKGYEFLPMWGKQVSSRQMIIPCFYRNYICFAKIEYN